MNKKTTHLRCPSCGELIPDILLTSIAGMILGRKSSGRKLTPGAARLMALKRWGKKEPEDQLMKDGKDQSQLNCQYAKQNKGKIQ